jgi:hypothetical protein
MKTSLYLFNETPENNKYWFFSGMFTKIPPSLPGGLSAPN